MLKTQLDEGSAIASWSRSLQLLTAQLKASDPDLRSLLATGPQSLGVLTTFLQDNRSDLNVLLSNLATTGEVMLQRKGDIEQILIAYPAVAAGGLTVTQDGNAHFGFVVNFDDPPPCVAGYGGTTKRQPSDTTPTAPNVAAHCAAPRGSATSVRGAQNAPGGDPVDTSAAGYVPASSPSVAQSDTRDVSTEGKVLGDAGWLALMTDGVTS